MRWGKGPLREETQSYLDRLLPPRAAALRAIEEEGAEEGFPSADPALGRLLEVLIRTRGARRVLEIGGGLGYSAIAMARAGDAVEVISLEMDPARAARAQANAERAGVGARVLFVTGRAPDAFANLPGPFDLVFLDVPRGGVVYRRLLDQILPKLAVGGVLVADNVLWGGLVADPESDDPVAEAMRSFNGYLMMHPQLSAVVLPLGDGVAVAVKTKPLITEQGGPW